MTTLLKHFIIWFCCLMSLPLWAQQTETLYLSGTGLDDTRTWRFFCSEGMNAGRWQSIEVPSQWELQGFGGYTYGRYYLTKGAKPCSETGCYRYDFTVPSAWRGRQVAIVFEGVMTDTQVRVNDHQVGPVHQGGFYRFSYDISDCLRYGRKNHLEVMVWKESANRSVTAAERRADWWLFGGIYRPVYLRALPARHIERVAVDARADGSLTTELHLSPLPEGCTVELSLTPEGTATAPVVGMVRLPLTTDPVQRLSTQWSGLSLWDCEHPNLYKLHLSLVDAQGVVLHRITERIGFRTIDFRRQDGIYVNGTKIVVKGTNRHSFHPDGGRTTSRALSLQDARLIKEMNMNAVRSHYPPDTHFLDICDSLGLFYLDEFAGWQNAYDDTTGMKLLPEMLVRDVNHPCIFLWGNGNEGGWNTHLDAHFADYDLQQRHVVHPWSDFNGLDTHHYPSYQTGMHRLAGGSQVFMPTEFLHGLYDRGQGAGLDDYWANYCASPLFAGGFLWSYVDEAVRRTDRGGILDSDGPNGPDGIVGPRREKEGSFFTVREVWSPIVVEPLAVAPSFSGRFKVRNAYLFSNLCECSMKYKIYAMPSPLVGGGQTLLSEGIVALPAVDPGETGTAQFALPPHFFEADVLELTAYDRLDTAVCTRTFPIHRPAAYFDAQLARYHCSTTSVGRCRIGQDSGRVVLQAAGISVSFMAADGRLCQVRCGDTVVPLTDGPIPVGMKADFIDGKMRTEGDAAIYVARYRGAVDSIVWRLTADGLLFMDALVLNRPDGGGYHGAFVDNKINHFGFSFSFPESVVSGVRWFGRGPYRVWKNRIKGTNYGIWQKAYNNTITGEDFEHLIYPEFKGYHANLYWATFESPTVPFTVYAAEDDVFLRLFTPEEPAARRNGENTMQKFPVGDLSFLYEIPAMRSYKPISELGPHSQPSVIRIKKGDAGLTMRLRFDFR